MSLTFSAIQEQLREGNLAQAQAHCENLLLAAPDDPNALQYLAQTMMLQGRFAAAAAELRKALKSIGPDPYLLGNLGVMLMQAGDFKGAIESLSKAVARAPTIAALHFNLGNSYGAAGDPLRAIDSYRAALRLDPGHAGAHNNLGVAYRNLQQFDAAAQSFRNAITFSPNLASAQANLGGVLLATGSTTEGLQCLRSALLLEPNNSGTLRDLAAGLMHSGDYPEALALYALAVRQWPHQADILNEFGAALHVQGHSLQALQQLDFALSQEPEFAQAHVNRAAALLSLRRPVEALESARRAIALDSSIPEAAQVLLQAQRECCDWQDDLALRERILQLAIEGPAHVAPHALMWIADDPTLQAAVAARHAPQRPRPRRASRTAGARIRIAYVSPDFGNHPVGESIVALLENHNRAAVELTLVALAPDDGSHASARIRATGEQVIEAGGISDTQIAAELARRDIDILVDLAGHTRGGRPTLLAKVSVPLVVNYLGYPGTLGTPNADYLMADRCSLPTDLAGAFSEQFVSLSSGFIPTDISVRAAIPGRTRAQERLPEAGMLLCGFCNAQKLSPELFDAWLRILSSSDDAVLWLQTRTSQQASVLRNTAASAGIDPMRLVFATHVESREHYLARLALADLFLDSTPYNGHTTVRDALWAGVPVLTVEGRGLASRVGGSLARAVGLAELATANLANYEAAAKRLLANPAYLSVLRAQVQVGRGTTAVFSPARLAAEVETAFREMLARFDAGLPPAPLTLSADGQAHWESP